MSNFASYICNPFKALRNARQLSLCAMLIALAIVTSLLSGYITIGLKVSFSFLFIAVIGMKYGPIIAGMSAAVVDVVQHLVKPVGAYIPQLTVTAAIGGIIYGIFLYKNKNIIWRLIISHLTVVILISVLLNSYVLMPLVGKAYIPFMTTRAVKCLIEFPADILLMIAVFRITAKIEKPTGA